MDEIQKTIQKLLELDNNYNNDDDDAAQEFHDLGKTLNKSNIQDILHTSIIQNISADNVLRAIIDSVSEGSHKLYVSILKAALQEILIWDFVNLDQAHQFTLVTSKMAPQILSPEQSIKFITFIYKRAKNAEDDSKRPYVVEACLSLIPQIILKLWDNQTLVTVRDKEDTCQNFVQKWIDDILESEIPDFIAAPLIDAFSVISLREEQFEQLINNVFSNEEFGNISKIAESLFPAIKKFPKLTDQCLKKIIRKALDLENRDFTGSDPNNVNAECSLIKILYRVSNTSRNAFNSLFRILTTQSELPTHLTPFLVSLAFDVLRLHTKIQETTKKFFSEKIKNDSIVAKSHLLKHIRSRDYRLLNEHPLEQVMLYAIKLSETNLDTNARHFSEFAFILIDTAKESKYNMSSYSSSFYVESESEFMDESVRQIKIGIMILQECLQRFPSLRDEIFGQIVQRLITNSTNSIYLVECLDYPENLLEVIGYLQYLDLHVVEQLMRHTVPKIRDNPEWLDRAIKDAKKAFINRTEKAKLNGIAALFYLVLPQQEQTFTQVVRAGLDSYDIDQLDSLASEDVRHDIFLLMKRGFTQSEVVQSNIYFFIPFLLQRNPEMAAVIISSLTEKLDSICTSSNENLDSTNETNNYGFAKNFPLIIDSSIPHFLFCLSRCLHILPKQETGFSQTTQNNWDGVTERLKQICEDVSNVDFEYLLNTMDIFVHPDERECVIAIISVLFNHCLTIDKDIALSLFRLYDRIIHKKIEMTKLNKDDLGSGLKFPTFMDLSTLTFLFKKLGEANGDYSDNYGIQLYALETAKSMINELPDLRLEQRGDRLKIAMELGGVLFDSLTTIKWSDAPAGYRGNNSSLQEIVTTCIRQLFMFIFETYKEDAVEKFLQKTSCISVNQKIADAHVNILRLIKTYVRQKNSNTMIDNMCKIAESLSLISYREEKNYATVKKMLLNQISINSPQAGRFMKLVRSYSEYDLLWMNDFATAIIDSISRYDDLDENQSLSCSALLEFINTLTIYLDDIKFANKVWIPQVAANDHEKTAQFASNFYGYMLQIVHITEMILEINFNRFPFTYYETFVKFIKNIYTELNKIPKQVIDLNIENDSVLDDLLKKVTSVFDQNVNNFSIRNQGTNKIKNSRQSKFDARLYPDIHSEMIKLRTSIKTLAQKGKIDADIPNGFYHVKGIDVKLPSSKKKKQKKAVHEEDVVFDQDEIELVTNVLRNSLHNENDNDEEHNEEEDDNGSVNEDDPGNNI